MYHKERESVFGWRKGPLLYISAGPAPVHHHHRADRSIDPLSLGRTDGLLLTTTNERTNDRCPLSSLISPFVRPFVRSFATEKREEKMSQPEGFLAQKD